jgi:2-aminobenzoate-CoA ligase
VFIGSPPLAFNFGLGWMLLFPMSVGATNVELEKAAPADQIDAALKCRATVMYTAPT